MSKVKTGFVPIPFDRYVDLHVQSNPSVDKAEFARRLRQAVGCAQGWGALCLWSIHLGDRIGRGPCRMLYVYYRRGVAG